MNSVNNSLVVEQHDLFSYDWHLFKTKLWYKINSTVTVM